MTNPMTPRSILRPAAILFVVAFVAYLPVLAARPKTFRFIIPLSKLLT